MHLKLESKLSRSSPWSCWSRGRKLNSWLTARRLHYSARAAFLWSFAPTIPLRDEGMSHAIGRHTVQTADWEATSTPALCGGLRRNGLDCPCCVFELQPMCCRPARILQSTSALFLHVSHHLPEITLWIIAAEHFAGLLDVWLCFPPLIQTQRLVTAAWNLVHNRSSEL